MKKVLLVSVVLLSVLIFQNNMYSQSGWFWQNPLPTGNSLNSVKFIDVLTGIAVGESGTILLSTNSGITWRIVNTNSRFRLNSVCVLDSLTLIAVGDSGKIKKTTDRGNIWFSINSGITSDFNSVVFVSSQTGFIGGDSVVLKSVNGGNNWSVQFTTSISIIDLQFINENTGWMTRSYYNGYACPIHDEILKTTNGGINWTSQLNNCHYGTVLISSIFFVNSNTGWCSNSKTTNGGSNWFTQYPIGRKIFFMSENKGFKTIFNSKDTLYLTSDGGNNWLTSNGNLKTSLNSIFFINSQSGWGVGKYGNSIKTNNGGLNWISSSDNSCSYNDIQSLSFIDSSNGYAGCRGGIVLKTSNSGINWIPYFTGDTSNIVQLCFRSPNVGFAANSIGKILKTTNGGENWSCLLTTNSDQRSIYFIDNNTGWAGAGETLYKTTDGGLNWSTRFMNGMIVINSIYFINQETGWATGWNILKTTDGGNSWVGKLTGTQNFFGSVFFKSENLGWVNKQSDGEILKTTNGGNNWIYIYPGNRYWLNDIYFIDSLKGLAVGEEFRWDNQGGFFGAVLETTNGGNNWFSLPTISSEQNWTTLCFTSSEKGWVAGKGGAILKNSNFIWGPVGIKSMSDINIGTFSLSQNYPNPFNPSTAIKFDISKSTHVQILVYDILGREVGQLLNENKKPGSYEITWDGSRFASGIYFYKIITDEFVETKKMVLMK
jgi:photosystem II stability/assembly factor-like uncharacterized protein